MSADSAKVLVIDDEPHLRDIWRELFRLLEVEAVLADSVARGIELFESSRILFVISDLRMPGEDGFSFLEYLSDNAIQDVPVFICSGFLENQASSLAGYSIQRIIPKPFDLRAELQFFRNFIESIQNK